MLVDLGRNDVGRVARYGSVELTDVMTIERYSHVMHITSNVNGQLAPERDAFDALRACLPAGTVSGKVTAVNEELTSAPEKINTDAHNSWIMKVEVANAADASDLLSKDAYETYIKEETH